MSNPNFQVHRISNAEFYKEGRVFTKGQIYFVKSGLPGPDNIDKGCIYVVKENGILSEGYTNFYTLFETYSPKSYVQQFVVDTETPNITLTDSDGNSLKLRKDATDESLNENELTMVTLSELRKFLSHTTSTAGKSSASGGILTLVGEHSHNINLME